MSRIQTTISIAMCTFNGEKYIQEQLESIANQTQLPSELVICDDCSNDNTANIIRRFCQKVPFNVHLYINEYNIGIIKNFEKAIRLCRGDIIVLSDQDDVWCPEKLREINNCFRTYPEVGAVFTDAIVVNDQLEEINPSLWKTINFSSKEQKEVLRGKAYESLLRRNFVTGATLAFRGKYKQEIFPIPNDLLLRIWVHDGWIALVISALSEISFIEKPLIKYRQHSNNQAGLKGINLKENIFNKFLFKFKEDPLKKSKLKEEALNYEKLLKHFYQKNSIASKKVKLLEEKIKHNYMRINLSKSFIRKAASIINDLLALKYYRFSNGIRTALKDLILS